MGEDRRRAPRTAIAQAPAALVVDGCDIGQVYVEDASAVGLFVAHPSPILPAGVAIELRFPKRPPLVVRGRIARVVRGEDGKSGYGVELAAPEPTLVSRLLSLPAPPKAPAEPPGDPAAVLIIEDDLELARAIIRILGTVGLVAHHETHAVKALEAFQVIRPTLRVAIVDLLLPDASGEDVIRKLKKEKPRLGIVAMSAFVRNAATKRLMLGAGAQSFLAKPFDSQELCRTVLSLVESG